jgi:hypothetical protein
MHSATLSVVHSCMLWLLRSSAATDMFHVMKYEDGFSLAPANVENTSNILCSGQAAE